MDTDLHFRPPGGLQRLLRRTIWNKAALVREVPERFVLLFTVLLPVAYALLFLFGALGTLAQAPGILADATSGAYSAAWTVVVALVSPVCFFALVLLRPRVELLSSLVLAVILAVYPLALAAEGLAGNDWRSVALAAALLLLPLMVGGRAVDLVRVARRRDV